MDQATNAIHRRSFLQERGQLLFFFLHRPASCCWWQGDSLIMIWVLRRVCGDYFPQRDHDPCFKFYFSGGRTKSLMAPIRGQRPVILSKNPDGPGEIPKSPGSPTLGKNSSLTWKPGMNVISGHDGKSPANPVNNARRAKTQRHFPLTV